ncbi:MAG: hypothetical protein LBG20_03720 [Holosporaceae bacterium]|nr:hypothetical protein [Holosporaceae bacterium]
MNDCYVEYSERQKMVFNTERAILLDNCNELSLVLQHVQNASGQDFITALERLGGIAQNVRAYARNLSVREDIESEVLNILSESASSVSSRIAKGCKAANNRYLQTRESLGDISDEGVQQILQRFRELHLIK